MGKWAKGNMLEQLGVIKTDFKALLEEQELELKEAFDTKTRGIKFSLRKKRKQNLADEVEENLVVWTSGLQIGLVEFAIRLAELREFLQRGGLQNAKSDVLKDTEEAPAEEAAPPLDSPKTTGDGSDGMSKMRRLSL